MSILLKSPSSNISQGCLKKNPKIPVFQHLNEESLILKSKVSTMDIEIKHKSFQLRLSFTVAGIPHLLWGMRGNQVFPSMSSTVLYLYYWREGLAYTASAPCSFHPEQNVRDIKIRKITPRLYS